MTDSTPPRKPLSQLVQEQTGHPGETCAWGHPKCGEWLHFRPEAYVLAKGGEPEPERCVACEPCPDSPDGRIP